MLALYVAQADPIEPGTQTVIYYNARLALREDNPGEAVKLWLLRNSVEHNTRQISPHDSDFASVTWVAMSDMGLCPIGLAEDDDGAGLWPVALHNWVVRTNTPRRPSALPNPWQTLERERQSRRVSVDAVLGADELSSLELNTPGCSSERTVRHLAGAERFADVSEPKLRLEALTQALTLSRETLAPQVRGTALIEARLFDLHLAQVELATDEQPFDEDSELSRIPAESVTWPASEWMALSPERRRFLFDYARQHTQEHDALNVLAMDILSAVILDGAGDEVGEWIARCGPDLDRQQVWGSTLGALLGAMGPQSGFRERSALALHRGARAVEVGDADDAVRSFALALHHADESAQSEVVHALALRWMSYVATQFEITDPLLDILHTHVSSRDAEQLLEDLLWAAALRSDAASFSRGMDDLPNHGTRKQRLAPLGTLASGDSDALLAELDTLLQSSPREGLRFVSQLVEHLELEDADVRTAHARATLDPLVERLQSVVDGELGARHTRDATALQDRIQAIVRGVGAETASVGPAPITYAGSVRLAPTDTLPWPFHASEPPAPSAFTPLTLTPVEWLEDDAVVFGWELSE